MRALILALEQVRRRILRVIDALEDGDNDRALRELAAAENEWRDAIRSLRTTNGSATHLGGSAAEPSTTRSVP